MWFKKKMKTISIFIFFLISTLYSQSTHNRLTDKRTSEFINALIYDSDSLEIFVLPEELTISKRLGINYEGVKNKFLISYEIPEEIQKVIKDGTVDYSIAIENLDDQFSILHFECSEKNYKTKYYFKDSFLISPPYFYYKDWQKIESEHFIFYVSEPENFSQYSIDRLEKFAKNIFSVLKYTEAEKQILKKEKLIYLLCKDEDEIEKLTGYKARGMGNLAYDYVITTYNCHYHELLHILMNFKLKKLPLYTHPFLQEGFAVALGGRGGYETGIILNLGKFLEQSEFLSASQLFNYDEYKTYDVSMSYPLSGLYNLFLINEIGIDKYIKLYLKYSSDNISKSVINSTGLPAVTKWQNFVNQFTNSEEIEIDFPEENFETLIEDSNYVLKEIADYYLFEIKGNILLSTPDKKVDYISKIFKEFYPDHIYSGQKYLIRINDSEIVVYNLYTNNLIANYASGFTLDMKTVPSENGFYRFLLDKTLFDENFDEWKIKVSEK